MGNIVGFLQHDREGVSYDPVTKRVKNYKEFTHLQTQDQLVKQASRCMDCGVPFCHTGCPLNNQIPDWNDLVYQGDWKAAIESLHATNNFPEFTGRICPAPCEYACTLYLEDQPVTIKNIEQALIDNAFEQGWIKPQLPQKTTDKKVAIIGSGPAGLAAAQQLARVGHAVTVFEREEYIGGLLRYGIPDFKMEKHIIERRKAQMEAEGVTFKCNSNVGVDFSLNDILAKFDAVLVTIGAENPREVGIGGLEFDGVDYAMPYLRQQNKRVSGEQISTDEAAIIATDKDVVVIGGGDTASDCIGTAIRQNCKSVTQLDIRQEPPNKEEKGTIWPYWPTKMRVSSSQEEGAMREFAIATLNQVIAEDGKAAIGVRCARVDSKRKPIAGTEFVIEAQLILHAIGFSGILDQPLIKQLQPETDARGNILANTNDYKTNIDRVYAAGDARKGQSLVVWAIKEGRQAAREIDIALSGFSFLPR